jgi:hypothetical protein
MLPVFLLETYGRVNFNETGVQIHLISKVFADAYSYFYSYFSVLIFKNPTEALIIFAIINLERVKGIEPSSQPWEGHILPLNHTRLRSNAADPHRI